MNRLKILLSLLIAITFSSCIIEKNAEIIDDVIYVRHKGADMPAYIHGNAESNTFLFVIHGAGSFGLSFRDENFIKKLEDDYVVVYFDNRAQSMSQGHFFENKDIIDLMAEDVEALTKVIKHKYGDENSFFLMGHSLGGLITGKALLRQSFQDQFNGWINVDGVLDMPSIMAYRVELLDEISDEQIDLGNSVDEWLTLEETLKDIDYDAEEAYAQVFDLVVDAYALVQKDNLINTAVSADRIFQTVFVNNPLTWQISHLFHKPEVSARLDDYSIVDDLHQISIPCLFMYGKYDFSVPPDSGEDGFNVLSTDEKTFSIYERTTHHPFVTESIKFTNEVKRFIEDFK